MHSMNSRATVLVQPQTIGVFHDEDYSQFRAQQSRAGEHEQNSEEVARSCEAKKGHCKEWPLWTERGCLFFGPFLFDLSGFVGWC